jgi:DNA-binding MarR family transcriptional regulator
MNDVTDPLAEPIHLLRTCVLNLVREKVRDLSLRQLAVLLVCNSTDDPQTVRGLARHLVLQKPVVTRGADRLEAAGLLRRKRDPADARSVLLVVIPAGRRYCEKFYSQSGRPRVGKRGK